jgi:integrase
LVRSLKTNEPTKAKLLEHELRVRQLRLFEKLRAMDTRTLAETDIEKLVAEYLDEGKRDRESEAVEIARATMTSAVVEAHLDESAVIRKSFDDNLLRLKNLDTERMEGAAAGLLERAGLVADNGSEAYQRLLYRLMRAAVDVSRYQLEEIGESVTPSVHATPPKPSPLVSKVVADYVAFKESGNKWTPKTRTQITTMLRVMVELIGDRPIRDVSKEDMRELYRLLPQFPTHAIRHYPDLSALDAIAAADSEENDSRLMPSSLNDYFTHMKSFFKWAVENDYIDKSPAVVLKEVDERDAWDQRPAFSDYELKCYFRELRAETDPAMLLIPKLMLFCGLRLEEAAKLRPDDIKQEQGVYLVDINHQVGRLKNKHSARLVPLHSAIEAEIRSQAAGVKRGENLWGLQANAYGTYSAALSKRLNARLDRAVPDNDKLVTYSLRHTFATKLKHSGAMDTKVAELMGHKVEGLSFGRYGKEYPTAVLKECVELLKAEL